MSTNNLEIHVNKNKFNDSDSINYSISKINKILGPDFELTIDTNSKLDTENVNSKLDTENVNSKLDTENVNSKLDTENVNSKLDTENVNSKLDKENVNSKLDTENVNSKLDILDTNTGNIIKNSKILNFKFINKSELKNSEKSEYINKKIEMLKNNNFIEVEEIKISGVGRFIKIFLKSVKDYEDDKILLLKEFMEKINIIDEKINILKK